MEFKHTVSPEKPLESIVIATSPRNLDAMPNNEGEFFSSLLETLVNPADHYVEGPQFFMSPEMQSIVDSVFQIEYHGKTKMMFFRSQMTTLLSHFFGQLATMTTKTVKEGEREKLYQAKEFSQYILETAVTVIWHPIKVV